MAVESTRHWMDRVSAVDAKTKARRAVSLVSIRHPESRELIAARAALHARKGVSQDALHLLARDRRSASLKAARPSRLLLAGSLLVVAIAACAAGSAIPNQALLLAGFGIGAVGLMVACTLLAGLLDAQMGDLAGFLHADETPATADEIAALSRATQADPELDKLIGHWWKDSGAPIRRHDLDLVWNFQKAKQAA